VPDWQTLANVIKRGAGDVDEKRTKMLVIGILRSLSGKEFMEPSISPFQDPSAKQFARCPHLHYGENQQRNPGAPVIRRYGDGATHPGA
jgi:hypothetical protein